MAKLFANKFDLDNLPDPKKPKQDIEQGSTTIHRTAEEDFITNPNIQTSRVNSDSLITDPKLNIKPVQSGDRTTNPDLNIKVVDQGSKITDPQLDIEPVSVGDRTTNPNIRVSPVEPIDINTQQLNSKLREVDNQKNAMSTSDEILESQGVRKSSAEQYVSRTRVEPFGEKPVEQGSTNIKPFNQSEDKVSLVDVKKFDQGSMITDPKTIIQKVEPGDKITNPNTQVKLVDQNEFIVNPDITVKKVIEGELTINPDIKTVKVRPDELIVNPNIRVDPVDANEKIVNPNIKINRVDPNEKIVNPNINPQPAKAVDPASYIPDNVKGSGVTKFFPSTISLKDRLKQASIGTTRHLPEYILSDLNTGFITIKNPKVIEITSRTDAQRLQYTNTILEQGGVEDSVRGLVSITNPLKFGEDKPNQGSIVIKNNQTVINKPSPVEIKRVNPNELIVDPELSIQKVKPGERTVDPNTIIKKVEPGDRITNPNTIINKIKPGDRIVDPQLVIPVVEPGERTVDPNLQIKPVVPGERTINPNIQVTKVTPNELITNPDIQIPLVKPGERTTDPQTQITPVVPGERTTDPQLVIPKVKPGSRTTDPKIKIPIVKPGERTVDPKTVINKVKPGERTFDPQTVIIPIIPGDRITIVENRLLLFPQVDDKIFYTQEPFYFLSDTEIFQGATTTQVFNIPDFQTLGYFVSDVNLNNSRTFERLTTDQPLFTTPNEYGVSRVPQFVKDAGLSYGNQYSDKNAYVKSLTKELLNEPSPLTEAGQDAETAITLTHKTSIDGVISEEAKPVLFPAQQSGDPSLPGGYRALTYGQIQKRAKDPSTYRNRDYTYSDDEPTLEYWRTRLGMPDKGADTINQQISSTARDMVTVKFESNRDGITLQFRSYLKAFSDSFTPSYTDVNYVGRPDTLKVFKGTTRQITLGFIVPVLSESELKVVYQKLESLVKIGTMGKKMSSFYLHGPFLKLTIGGWCKDAPIIVNSLKFDTQVTDYTWDIKSEVPQIVDVSMDCIALSDNTGTGFYTDGTYIHHGR